jgi:hypothetical protein
VQARIVDDQLVVYSAEGGVAVVNMDDGLVWFVIGLVFEVFWVKPCGGFTTKISAPA